MLSGKRVLVVEEQFLVALDMQRVLEEAHAHQTVFARSIDEAMGLAGRFGEFHVAIVETHNGGQAAHGLIRSLLAAGVAVVATTAAPDPGLTLAGFHAVPLVRKPFCDLDLLTACAIALAGRSDRR